MLKGVFMKFWVKIVVAFSIVVVACVGVWAFFFKETDEKIAYNRLCEVVDYKQSLGLRERTSDLQECDYYGKDKSNSLFYESEDGKRVENFRKIILSRNPIEATSASTYGSYVTYDKMVDEIIEYILPYLNGDRVNSKARRTATKAISAYVDSLDALSIALDDVVYYQDNMTGESNEYGLLANYYNEFRVRYRKSLECAGDVITTAIEYVNTSIYDGDFKFDATFAISDAFGIALKTAMSTELIREVEFSCDAYTISLTLTAHKEGVGIFDSTSPYYNNYGEYEFLQSYGNLFDSHRDTLKSVLSNPNAVKKEMAGGESGLSGIVESAQRDVVVILNVLDFGA